MTLPPIVAVSVVWGVAVPRRAAEMSLASTKAADDSLANWFSTESVCDGSDVEAAI